MHGQNGGYEPMNPANQTGQRQQHDYHPHVQQEMPVEPSKNTQHQPPASKQQHRRQPQQHARQGQRNQRPAPAPADFTVVKRILESAKESFEKITTTSGLDIKFFEECLYAQQLIEANYNNANDKNYSLASAHEDSIRNALILVANSGLTLNPQLGLAYLVPRWNSRARRLECHLEPSYKGLRRLGIDSGAIDSAVAELVYERDDFKWNDRFTKPHHEFDPFCIDRGKLKGGYCLARRPDGSFICTPVNMEMLNKIRALSRGGIWNEWYEQMVAKSVIRQGFKDWPINSTGPIAARVTAMQDYLKSVDANTEELDANSPVAGQVLPQHIELAAPHNEQHAA
ncbi:recombinase RecT [Vibrio parahaemolyticus]|uniref:recombinase RecT n=1 Tax=Vibrio parahaemolyticus TaxID=670 RepID=UPI0023ECA996|nr:recombinase RecT [Vibrio parahaemolyticus]